MLFTRPRRQRHQLHGQLTHHHHRHHHHIIWICYGAPIRSSEAPYKVKYSLGQIVQLTDAVLK